MGETDDRLPDEPVSTVEHERTDRKPSSMCKHV